MAFDAGPASVDIILHHDAASKASGRRFHRQPRLHDFSTSSPRRFPLHSGFDVHRQPEKLLLAAVRHQRNLDDSIVFPGIAPYRTVFRNRPHRLSAILRVGELHFGRCDIFFVVKLGRDQRFFETGPVAPQNSGRKNPQSRIRREAFGFGARSRQRQLWRHQQHQCQQAHPVQPFDPGNLSHKHVSFHNSLKSLYYDFRSVALASSQRTSMAARSSSFHFSPFALIASSTC